MRQRRPFGQHTCIYTLPKRCAFTTTSCAPCHDLSHAQHAIKRLTKEKQVRLIDLISNTNAAHDVYRLIQEQKTNPTRQKGREQGSVLVFGFEWVIVSAWRKYLRAKFDYYLSSGASVFFYPQWKLCQDRGLVKPPWNKILDISKDIVQRHTQRLNHRAEDCSCRHPSGNGENFTIDMGKQQ